MYKLEVYKDVENDVEDDLYEFVLNDLVNTIPEKISDVNEETIQRKNNIIYFETNLSEKAIKEALKSTFTHHIENMHFKSLCKYER